MSPSRLLLLAAIGTAAVPGFALADGLETPVVGASNLTSAGGWQAWSVPQAGGGHRLQLRAPDGTLSTPAIRPFGAPVDPALGTSFLTGTRELLAVYPRCQGTSTIRGCDLFTLSTASGVERRVPLASSENHSETAPSLNLGTYAFVRRGGPRNGVHTISGGARRQRPTRIVSTVARETATNGTRVGYIAVARGKGAVVVRRISGEGRPLRLTEAADGVPTSIQMTRYRAAFLLPGRGPTRIFETKRFAGSGGPFKLTLVESTRRLPAGVTSAAGSTSTPFTRYLAADGVTLLDPPAFGSGGA